MSRALPVLLISTLYYLLGFYLLERHLTRLFNSAKYFHEGHPEIFTTLPTSEEIASKIVEETEPYRRKYEHLRIRLLLNPCGSYRIQVSEETPSVFNVVADKPVDSQDVFLRHKTTYRATYNQARERAEIGKAGGPLDVILFNERGEVTETSIGNIAIEVPNSDGSKSIWKTPSIHCGLLGGVHREEMLARKEMIEGIISLDDLFDAAKNNRRMKIFNSVRKEIHVCLKKQDS
ncbi:D-aminoacid aminotransferase-like PLP-dependent enzyme [Basidiobolus meristosporus CBS 931.73]|uniref:D-aminoacid aminotransferase-like PLP-dependent enzyme n=1 Tax=Basidiobolus meristosporus CBS 931.73 TaxID=1314790 RepID=A0A1Y1Y2B1_9FUNG|nr:D-aminoacid aminotransferase-like PLP-dependent enzyme [Basidiobolus meristosporus CBS 931.73]|eukprot:ORX92015.1 D-aminoacid aminotransferase-like PLP-dependent enzyme [Basidiobolus meristosporus CBS 931.73]